MTVAVFFFVVGLLLGGLVAYLWARGVAGRVAQARAAAEARAAEVDRQRQEVQARLQAVQAELSLKGEQLARAEAERNLLAGAQGTLQNSFRVLSAEALKENKSQFLEQAQNLVQPLQQTLLRLQKEIQEIEGRRGEAFQSLEIQLLQLQRETANLTTALRRPQVRGRWGEITLRRVVEAAGMSSYCDFTSQATLESEDGARRPDLVIHLPGRREIVVDSKAPLDAYLLAMEAATEQERAGALKRHAQQVRNHMEHLSDKNYWDQLPTSPDFVVLFLPGESFFSAALEQDRTLIEDGIEKRVLLATPTTLIALLKAIAYGWRQEQIAESTQQIGDLGKELYDRAARMTEYLQELGRALSKALDSYNRTIGSFENRVLVTTRKFKELGATVSEDIPVLEPVDRVPRSVGQQSLDPDWESDQPPEQKK